MNFSTDDYFYMQYALRLAEASTVQAAPNPGVGCVLVKNGQLLGEGKTQPPGSDHAEIQALKHCLARGVSPAGATLYVTLEPCSHHGRTPPCTQALIEHGVARIIVATVDPYPAVAGRGLEILRRAGCVVDEGLMKEQALRVHRGFLSRIQRQRPYITIKLASSLDGKTALLNGKSQWITGPQARLDVQKMRAAHCAVLTGSGTVRADNPRLTVREVPVLRQPIRIVVDSDLATSPSSEIYQGGSTILATTLTDLTLYERWSSKNVTIIAVPRCSQSGRMDLTALMNQLAARGINMLMVEAGPGLCGALVQAGLVDEIVMYIAPRFLGHAAHGLFTWPALADLGASIPVVIQDIRKVGMDMRIELKLAASQANI